MKYVLYISILFVLMLSSCKDDDGAKLPSTTERVEKAINELHDALIYPENGWQLNYQPTSEAGFYYMLLEFDDKEVTIKSDVPDEDGVYYEQTIPYRLDPQLGIELIFETYGVFHYLFELEQSTFGAEFEFTYIGEQNGNLSFSSKSDFGDDITIITLEAAPDNAEVAFSRTITENFKAYEALSPVIFGGQRLQQLYLEDHDISIFWNINFTQRNIDLDIAAVGETLYEIQSNNVIVDIDHFTGFTYANGKLVLLDPLSFVLSGDNYVIDEISLEDFSMTGINYCEGTLTNSPVYSGSVEGFGETTLRQTLFQSAGFDFGLEAEDAYSVNVLFVVNDEGFSLSNSGSINEYYPTASGFIFSFGLDSDQDPPVPSFGVGISFADEEGNGELHMREFESTTVVNGNQLLITLTDDFYYSNTPELDSEDHLRSITDEIFEGGSIYISDLPIDGIKVFRMFNPCNGYEFLVVQP